MNAEELLEFLLKLGMNHNLEEIEVCILEKYEDVIECASKADFDGESVTIY